MWTLTPARAPLVALAISLCTVAPAAAAAAPPGHFQYDVLMVPQSAGSFDADLATIKDAISSGRLSGLIAQRTLGKAYREHAAAGVVEAAAATLAGGVPGIGSVFQAAAARAAAAKNVSDIRAIQGAAVEGYAAQRQLGWWYHIAYLDGVVRVDDIEAASAYIFKPGQTLFLDLVLQTTAVMPPEWMVEATPNQTAATDPMCAPGTVKTSPGRPISGVSTTRYDVVWPTMSFTVFQSQYPAPHIPGPSSLMFDPLGLLHVCASSALQGGTVPKDRLVLDGRSGAYAYEVGNFSAAVDPALFEEPRGFTRLK